MAKYVVHLVSVTQQCEEKKTLVGFLNKQGSKRSLTKKTHQLMLLLLIDNVTRRPKAVSSEYSAAAVAL